MPQIKLTPVSSSSISAIGHDPDTETLHVEFHSGKVYRYEGINREAYERFRNAPSIGAHFGRHIRPLFDGRAIS